MLGGERREGRAGRVAIKTGGDAMGGANPELHLLKNEEHKVDSWEGETHSVATRQTEGGDNPVVAPFSVVVENSSRKTVVSDVVVGKDLQEQSTLTGVGRARAKLGNF